MLRVPRLHPHLAAGGGVGVAPGTASRLHQQRKQALRRTKVAAEERGVRVHRGHQRDAPKVVPFGDHLRAHQHVDLTGVHGAELGLQGALSARAVSVDAGNARTGQQLGQLLFQPLGAAAHGGNVEVAALRTGAWNTLGEAAMVAAQRAVELVEHAPCAAIRAAAFPTAIAAMQHRRVAAPIQEHQALFLALQPLLQCGHQRR